jgi:hypothetical protein
MLALRSLCCCFSAGATDYYLDPISGSTSNPGTFNSPWTSLEEVAGAGKTFVAGDELILLTGYHGSPLIRGYNDGHVIVRPSPGADVRLGKLLVTSASYWRIRGLKISPSFAPTFVRQTMVDTYGSASQIVIEDCEIMTVADSSAWTATDWDQTACNGILARGPFVTVRNNHFLNVNFAISITGVSNLVSGNVVENFSGDGLRGLGDYGVYEKNTIENCYAVNGNHDDGFQSWSTGEGGAVGTGVVRGIIIRGNTFLNHENPDHPLFGTMQGIGCFDGFFEDWLIENNIVITDHWHGITLLGATHCKIINNTVVDINTARPVTPWIQIGNHKNGAASTGNIVRNNLTTGLNIAPGSSTMDHNIEFSDPQFHFLNYAAHDLRLIQTSTAIDQGSVEFAPLIDHAGRPRPLDGLNSGEALPDIGAHEFAHPQKDSDNDGMTDGDEAVSGNSPLDPDDFFQVNSERAGSNLILSWPSFRGRNYSLHLSGQPSFPGDGLFLFAGTGATIRHTNEASTGPIFFQLQVAE